MAKKQSLLSLKRRVKELERLFNGLLELVESVESHPRPYRVKCYEVRCMVKLQRQRLVQRYYSLNGQSCL